MRRRDVIAVLGGVTMSSVAARGQQVERVRRVGVLMSSAANDRERRLASHHSWAACNSWVGLKAATYALISAGPQVT